MYIRNHTIASIANSQLMALSSVGNSLTDNTCRINIGVISYNIQITSLSEIYFIYSWVITYLHITYLSPCFMLWNSLGKSCLHTRPKTPFSSKSLFLPFDLKAERTSPAWNLLQFCEKKKRKIDNLELKGPKGKSHS